MAELAVTVERVAVIYDDQLFQMKNTKVATEAKAWHIIRQRGRGETGVYPGVSSLSSKSYDSSITLAVAPGHWFACWWLSTVAVNEIILSVGCSEKLWFALKS